MITVNTKKAILHLPTTLAGFRITDINAINRVHTDSEDLIKRKPTFQKLHMNSNGEENVTKFNCHI